MSDDEYEDDAECERYGPGAECITTSDECADAIRALKEKE